MRTAPDSLRRLLHTHGAYLYTNTCEIEGAHQAGITDHRPKLLTSDGMIEKIKHGLHRRTGLGDWRPCADRTDGVHGPWQDQTPRSHQLRGLLADDLLPLAKHRTDRSQRDTPALSTRDPVQPRPEESLARSVISPDTPQLDEATRVHSDSRRDGCITDTVCR